jgi:hypothetical protein
MKSLMNLRRCLVLHTLLCLSVVGANVVAEEANVPAFSIKENILMLYYKDISLVVPFYEETLGLARTYNDDWVKIYQITPTSFVALVQEGEGSFHRAQADNAVMLSIVTEQVDDWYGRLKRDKGIKFLKDIYNNEHAPIRAFLVEDPGGYSIEFFQWLESGK